MKHQDFRYRQFLPTIILQCMCWYLRYTLSCRNLEEMMEERGVEVDHTTLYRWVQKYAPELEERIRWGMPGPFVHPGILMKPILLMFPVVFKYSP